MNKHICKVGIPIYASVLLVIPKMSDDDVKSGLKAIMKKRYSDDFFKDICTDEDTIAGVVSGHKEYIALRFFTDRPSDEVVVHEAFHVVRLVMETAGVQLSDESEEAWAYLLDDTYTNIINILKDLKHERQKDLPN